MLARHYFVDHDNLHDGSLPLRLKLDDANKQKSKTNPPPTSNPPSESQEDGPGGSFNIAIQDGPEAGQTVPHLHVHILPRIRGSTAKPATTPSDAIYDQMAGEEGNVGGALWDREREREWERQREGEEVGKRPVPGGGFPRIEDADRMARGMAEMEAEARVYRGVLEEMGTEGQ